MFCRTPSLRSGCQPVSLILERLPADKDVERSFAFENGSELRLKSAGSAEASAAPGLSALASMSCC